MVKLSALGENMANSKEKQSSEREETGSSRTLFELLVLVNPPHVVKVFFLLFVCLESKAMFLPRRTYGQIHLSIILLLFKQNFLVEI